MRPDLPDAEPVTGEVEAYLVKPGDSLGIRFYKTPELNIDVPVRSDGKISVPPIGDVQAAGRKPEEIADALSKAFASELTNPRVTVVVQAFGGVVYVAGLVSKPIGTPFTNGLTAMQAIAMAGGFDDRAAVNSVILVRQEGGKRQGYRLALDQMVSGKNPGADVALRPGDIVYVPRSWISDVNLWVDQFILKNLPPIIPAGF
jgi:protein involved in polysaccharide export with SLBB domain